MSTDLKQFSKLPNVNRSETIQQIVNVNRSETIQQIIQKLLSIFVHYVNRRKLINLIYWYPVKGREHESVKGTKI